MRVVVLTAGRGGAAIHGYRMRTAYPDHHTPGPARILTSSVTTRPTPVRLQRTWHAFNEGALSRSKQPRGSGLGVWPWPAGRVRAEARAGRCAPRYVHEHFRGARQPHDLREDR